MSPRWAPMNWRCRRDSWRPRAAGWRGSTRWPSRSSTRTVGRAGTRAGGEHRYPESEHCARQDGFGDGGRYDDRRRRAARRIETPERTQEVGRALRGAAGRGRAAGWTRGTAGQGPAASSRAGQSRNLCFGPSRRHRQWCAALPATQRRPYHRRPPLRLPLPGAPAPRHRHSGTGFDLCAPAARQRALLEG